MLLPHFNTCKIEDILELPGEDEKYIGGIIEVSDSDSDIDEKYMLPHGKGRKFNDKTFEYWEGEFDNGYIEGKVIKIDEDMTIIGTWNRGFVEGTITTNTEEYKG